MNPLNPEAGATPAPHDPEDVLVAERSARVMWRAFPYFEWRYAARGRAFGRSDAGYLVTLAELGEASAFQQVHWLARLLAARGMPSILLEYQLESLGRCAQRRQRPSESRLRWLAARLRESRLGVLDAESWAQCRELCRAAARHETRRRGAGLLIAGAVADRVLGLGEHDEALVRWLSEAVPGEPVWSQACEAARTLALAHCRPHGSARK